MRAITPWALFNDIEHSIDVLCRKDNGFNTDSIVFLCEKLVSIEYTISESWSWEDSFNAYRYGLMPLREKYEGTKWEKYIP